LQSSKQTCWIPLPERNAIFSGTRIAWVFPNPNWPSLLLPQPYTSSSLVTQRMCSAPAVMLTTTLSLKLIICKQNMTIEPKSWENKKTLQKSWKMHACRGRQHDLEVPWPLKRSNPQENTFPSFDKKTVKCVPQQTSEMPTSCKLSTITGVKFELQLPTP